MPGSKQQKRDLPEIENVRSELAILQARIDSPENQVEDMKRAVTGNLSCALRCHQGRQAPR